MEKDGVAIVISNEGIEVTVTIDVNENWTVLAGAKIIESEGIAGGPTGAAHRNQLGFERFRDDRLRGGGSRNVRLVRHIDG